MAQIIGVRFQNAGKIYFFDANELDISVGEYVIVETVKGIELAEVTMGKRFMEDEELKAPLKPVIRKATAQDVAHAVDNRNHEKEAFGICQKKIGEHKLEMKLVGVEAAFDNSKITFFFTANGRVDFRSLVKDLASVFKTRIELRQIGVRDEARMIGGLGPCGRQICCGSFLEDFEPVSIKMAKEQNLSLNPTKISGVCGRLMCCLKYEEDSYEETRKRMPRIGKEVITPDGNGTVTELNIVKETVKVRIAKGDSFEINEYELENITRPGNQAGDNAPATDDPDETEESVQDEEMTEAEEKTTTEPENTTAKAETPAPDNTENKKPAVVNNQTVQSNQEKQKNQNNQTNQKRQLGQPVRREKKDNGNRPFNHKQDNRPARQDTAPVQAHSEKKPQPAPAPAPQKTPAKPANSWAADLERAMKAAENK